MLGLRFVMQSICGRGAAASSTFRDNVRPSHDFSHCIGAGLEYRIAVDAHWG